jgi:catechol 2,3-dioxygenase-like lactoylglutathione lyase family enzyme
MSEQIRNRWTEGAHHVGLTVPDLSDALEFFEEGLGFEPVGGVPSYPAAFVSDGSVMITLWQAENGAGAEPFDRHRNLGLHHLAIRTRAGTLDELHERLAERKDVEIEFSPEALGDGPTRHMMTLIPGGIRVEFIDPAVS